MLVLKISSILVLGFDFLILGLKVFRTCLIVVLKVNVLTVKRAGITCITGSLCSSPFLSAGCVARTFSVLLSVGEAVIRFYFQKLHHKTNSSGFKSVTVT